MPEVSSIWAFTFSRSMPRGIRSPVSSTPMLLGPTSKMMSSIRAIFHPAFSLLKPIVERHISTRSPFSDSAEPVRCNECVIFSPQS